MVAKVQEELVETRGRKKSLRPISKNGLFEDQWERILTDAQAKGIDGAVLLRQIVDWYFDAREQQEAKYATKIEFDKLEKPNKNKN